MIYSTWLDIDSFLALGVSIFEVESFQISAGVDPEQFQNKIMI